MFLSIIYINHVIYFVRRVLVGDVVVFKDPENPESYLVRRLAATEGYEMVSTDDKDEPFTLEKDECWMLADNEKLKPKVSPISINVQNISYAKNFTNKISPGKW